MTEDKFSKIDGDPLYASVINNFRNANLLMVQTLNFRTVKSTGYVYWDTGKIRVGNIVYDITGDNSGESKTDKLIIAVLDSSTETATISFEDGDYTFSSSDDEILLGYVDNSSRLYMFGQENQPNYSGYTLVKSGGSVNVDGEGYFLGAVAYRFTSTYQSSNVSTSLSLSIDGTSITSDSKYMSSSGSCGSIGKDGTAVAICNLSGPYKFNSNLTVSHSSSGGSCDTDYKASVYYYIK